MVNTIPGSTTVSSPTSRNGASWLRNPIEPGVYVDRLGGFRHSDTVVVRTDGIEILTDYPSDIESLTLPL